MSSSIGNFFACICEAICSMIFDPEVWYGSSVMITLPFSSEYTPRMRTLP